MSSPTSPSGEPPQASGPQIIAPSPPVLHGIQPPTGLVLSAKEKAVNWKVYKRQWDNYVIVAQLTKHPEDYRVTLFLYSIGPDAVKIYNSFYLSEENRRKLSEIMKEFDKYAIGETNQTYERYVFNSRDQKGGESINAYVGELRTLAQTCNFCPCLHDSLIRDRIVLGVHAGDTRKRLLRQTKLTLQKCIDIVKSNEASNTQMKKIIQTSKTEDVHKLKTRKPRKTEQDSRDKYAKHSDRKYPNRKHDNGQKPASDKPCEFCGRKHCRGRTNCSSWGRICGSCGKKIISQANVEQKKEHTKSKRMKQARKNSFIV